MEIIRAGGYQGAALCRFYGRWMDRGTLSELEASIETNIPAFCMVRPPDFFLKVNQRELMLWWKQDVPKAIRTGLWAARPLALSQVRMAADITLLIGFSINDNTVTAIVTQPTTSNGTVQSPNGPLSYHYSGMPDSSPGVFDPGWDGSQGVYFTDPEEPLLKFLQGRASARPWWRMQRSAPGSYWPAKGSLMELATFRPTKS